MTNGTESSGLGPATDARNQPVFDPYANVLQLVEAAILRQDDLRAQESRHSEEIGNLRAAHASEIRKLESDRLDAIRSVDVAAVQARAIEAETRASVLATTVVTTADALRTQVANAATTTADALNKALDPIKTDIADLRRVQYEQVGQKAQAVEVKQSGQWATGQVIAALIGLGAFISSGAAIIVVLAQ